MQKKFKSLFKIKGRKYYKKIISVFIIFLVIIVIPFASVTFMIAKKNITHSINSSNQTVLNQMKYNYTYFSETMSNITTSVFYQNDIQALMYNQEVEYYDLYGTMRALNTNTVSKQPSIQSIVIYNGQRKEFYSTETGGVLRDVDPLLFLEGEEDVPKLFPILRKVVINESNEDIYHYYFSYILYDYFDPITKKGSYIIVNQKGNWFLDNITHAVASHTKTDIYMTNGRGEIFNGSGDVSELSESSQYLIEKSVYADEGNGSDSDSGFFIDSYEGKRYLVSYVNLEDRGNILVMIQEYRDVFSDLIKLKNEFILICIVVGLFTIVLLIILSKRIYAPIKNLVNYVSDVSKKDGNSIDEFEHLKSQYDDVKQGKIELMKKTQSNNEIIQRYVLNNLLQNSGIQEWEDYKKRFPEFPLFNIKKAHSYIVLIRVDKKIDNLSLLKNDMDLVLYSIENIMKELLEEGRVVAGLTNELQDLVLVVNCNKQQEDYTKLNQSLAKMQDFVHENLGIKVSVAHTEPTGDVTKLSALYEQVKNLIKYQVIFKHHVVITMDKCQDNINNKELTYSNTLKKSLKEKIRLGNIDEVEEILWKIHHEICTLNHSNIMTNGIELLTRVNMTINEVNMLRNNPMTINFGEIYEKTMDLEYMEDWFKELISYIGDILSDTYQEKQKESAKDHIFINMITEYIDKNYQDFNLSSQSIADHIGMSSRYIMKKFKDITQTSLNQYISNIRMKEAVSLLTMTDMSVSEIAENVGIENENYFYRLFKKTYGCTPREFSST